jgi:transposase
VPKTRCHSSSREQFWRERGRPVRRPVPGPPGRVPQGLQGVRPRWRLCRVQPGRALYAIERDAKGKELTGAALAAYRQQHAGPVLAAFAAGLADQRPQVLPKSLIGEAVTYVTNQWPTLGVYLTDGRLTIDNGPAEQAVRPLAVGRKNWLHLGGDGALRPTAVLLSVTASVRRHGLDPWVYLKHVLTELPARSARTGLSDLLPDRCARSRAGPMAVPS